MVKLKSNKLLLYKAKSRDASIVLEFKRKLKNLSIY